MWGGWHCQQVPDYRLGSRFWAANTVRRKTSTIQRTPGCHMSWADKQCCSLHQFPKVSPEDRKTDKEKKERRRVCGNWGNGSGVKSHCCSCRGPEFSSQHLHLAAHMASIFSSRASNILFCPPQSTCMHKHSVTSTHNMYTSVRTHSSLEKK